jgi:glycerophosphoryl diester phosphodiesterase
MRSIKNWKVFSGFILAIWIVFCGFAIHFKDYTKLHTINTNTQQDLQNLFHYSGDPIPLVSAHRGGPLNGFPENCIATFENTLKHTYAIIECDPRYTKDSSIVLHHDPLLGRTSEGQGAVAAHTLKELKMMNLKDPRGAVTEYMIPTLDEALEWAKEKTIMVLDHKDVPISALIKKVEEHNAESNVILIVYSFEDARVCYDLNNNIMMEIMIPDMDRAAEFEKTGIPWGNVVAFVGHNLPTDDKLYELIHRKGALCIAGSSRTIDRKYLDKRVKAFEILKNDYMKFLNIGIDLIETDLPVNLGPMLFDMLIPASSKTKYFSTRIY